MKRMFEFRDGSSAKFWEIALEGSSVITRYGKIGSVGNNAHKAFGDEGSAKKEFEKLIKEKTKKGYLELGASDQTETGTASTSTASTGTASFRAGTTSAGVTTYLENADLNEFFEVNENYNQIRIRRGKIGLPCLEYHAGYKTKGRENHDRLIKEWKQKGFKVTKPQTPILEGSIADELIASEIEDHPVYSRIFEMGWGEELRGQEKRIFVFKNGLQWTGNLDFEEMADMGLTTGVIIEGDVNVSGVLSQLTYEYPNPILVTGNVKAQSFGHKDSHMRIDGDLRVENIVYGEYNDGQLEVGGDVYGKAWISADHAMYANGTYFLPTFHDEYDGLSPKVLNFDGGLDWDALREFIWENKNPLRKDFVFVAPEPKVRSAPANLIAQKMATGEQVESFKESDRSIQVLVEAITGKTGGKRTLKMLENPPPEELIRCHSHILLVNALLKNKEFPGAYFGLIERLVQIGCDPRLAQTGRTLINDSLLTDQADVVELMQRVLTDKPVWKPRADSQAETQDSELRRRVMVLAADENVEGMTQLLETWQDRSDEWLAFVAARLEAPSSTPEQRERLRALTPAWTAPVDDQVGDIPSAHPKIQALLRAMTFDNVDQIMQMLEEPAYVGLLKVHSWLLLDSARFMIQYGAEDYIQIIELLLELGCDPRFSYSGRSMVDVLNEGDDDAKTEILALFDQYFPKPGAKARKTAAKSTHVLQKLMDLEDQKADFDSDQEVEETVRAKLTATNKKILAKTKSLNKAANKIMQAQPAQALEQYSQALELARGLVAQHPDEFAYEALFALQGKLWCVNELVATQAERTPEAIVLANQVLEFTQENFEMFYSEMGALSRSSQTLAHNTLAWYALQTGVGLETALENANSAIEQLDYHSDAATYAVVLETKTKILFALERREEAFVCIYRMNREFPDVAYFKAQAQTPEFKRWDDEN
jgi:predicted DNA-binding WGR domain protein/tetratricopeptide (TPR) repeat protein